MNRNRPPARHFGSLESAESALHLELLSELGDVPWVEHARALVEESRASNPLKVFCLLSALPFLRTDSRPYTVSPALSEHAAYHLLPILPAEEATLTARRALRLIRLANLAFVGFTETETPELNVADPFQRATAQVSVNRDTYRGTRYDFQTHDLICGLQGRFHHWYEANLGIAPQRAAQLIQDIEQVVYERLRPLLAQASAEGVRRGRTWLPDWITAQFRRWTAGTSHQGPPGSPAQAAEEARLEVLLSQIDQVIPVGLADLQTKGHAYSPAEWQALQRLVGMTGPQAAAMQSPREAKGRPVKVLPDDRVVCLGSAFALDELHEKLDLAIRFSDMAEKYATWKGEWTETRAGQLLRKVFGDQVMVGVDYPDPDTSHRGTAEVDLMAWSGPYVVFVEVKARAFSAVNETGEIHSGRLRSDVQKNYAAAARQADRAGRYLQRQEERLFTERGSRREFRIPANTSLQALSLGVSLYHLAGLAQQAHGLGSASVPLTPSLSLADLELLCEFCDGPDVLIAYLIVRQQLLHLQERLQTHESDLFGLFLQRRLTDYPVHHPNAMYVLLGGQEPFDAWARSKARGEEDRIGTSLQGPPEILWLLAELRRIQSPESVAGAVQVLLGNSNEWRVMATCLRLAQAEGSIPGHLRRIFMSWRDLTICLLVRPISTSAPVEVTPLAPEDANPQLTVVLELVRPDSTELRVTEVNFVSHSRSHV